MRTPVRRMSFSVIRVSVYHDYGSVILRRTVTMGKMNILIVAAVSYVFKHWNTLLFWR